MWIPDWVGAAHARNLVQLCLTALIAGAIVAYPVLKALIAFKSRQTVYDLAPSTHQKKQGTPTMGGLIILVGVFAALLISDLNRWPLVLWMAGFALIGFADDFLVPRFIKGKRGLGWKQKIVGQVVLAFLGAMLIGLPKQFWPFLLCIFLILFFCNAYNFADGLDGLAGSLGLLLSFGFVALACLVGDKDIAEIFAILAGAFIPFLFLNAPPAKVFMGDVGSLPLGALFGLGVSSLLMDSSGEIVYPLHWRIELAPALLVLSVMMIIELVPVPMQVAYYKLTKKRIFPMTPIHHAFEVKGWPESKVVWTFTLAQLTLVLLSIGLAGSAMQRGMP